MKIRLAMILLTAALAGCGGAVELPAQTALPSDTPVPSATIQWFPNTATPTPRSVVLATPTPDPRPGLGEVILADDFSDETLWEVGRSAAGTVGYGINELTLAVAQSRGRLYSFRKDTLVSDFYLEMDILPSLCRGQDAFGLLFRVQNTTSFYRLLFNCQGQLRLERVSGGEPRILVNWTPLGQVSIGASQSFRVGIWMAGPQMRVLVNGVLQLEARDSAYQNGGLGVYAVSGGDTPLTVNFSALSVRAVSTASPTP